MAKNRLPLHDSPRSHISVSVSEIGTKIFIGNTLTGYELYITGDELVDFLKKEGFEIVPTARYDSFIECVAKLQYLERAFDAREAQLAYLERYLNVDNLNLSTNVSSHPQYPVSPEDAFPADPKGNSHPSDDPGVVSNGTSH